MKSSLRSLVAFLQCNNFIREYDREGRKMQIQVASVRKASGELAKDYLNRGVEHTSLFGHTTNGQFDSRNMKKHYLFKDKDKEMVREIEYMVLVDALWCHGGCEAKNNPLIPLADVTNVHEVRIVYKNELNAKFEVIMLADNPIAGVELWKENEKKGHPPVYMPYRKGFPETNNDMNVGEVTTQESPLSALSKDVSKSDRNGAAAECQASMPFKRGVKGVVSPETGREKKSRGNSPKPKDSVEESVENQFDGVDEDDICEMFDAMDSPTKIRDMVARNQKEARMATVVNQIEFGRGMVIGNNSNVTININGAK